MTLYHIDISIQAFFQKLNWKWKKNQSIILIINLLVWVIKFSPRRKTWRTRHWRIPLCQISPKGKSGTAKKKIHFVKNMSRTSSRLSMGKIVLTLSTIILNLVLSIVNWNTFYLLISELPLILPPFVRWPLLGILWPRYKSTLLQLWCR